MNSSHRLLPPQIASDAVEVNAAYLAAGRGQEAVAEFMKIISHRGIVLNEPIGALVHLQLGRAYVFFGDMPKAHAAYQDIVALWKDADPDIPVLREAQAEFSRLQ
jgi:hypothetical protein